LYSFKGGSDGAYPFANLIYDRGTLYGTTSAGGTGVSCTNVSNYGCGTVFSITPSGIEKVLYSFQGGTDAAVPWAGLIKVGRTFYGTTVYGGNYYYGGGGTTGVGGTVFSVTQKGAEAVVYSLGDYQQNVNPIAGLISVNGLLYGTAFNTVFSVTTTGMENIISLNDGGYQGGLLKVGSKFYGLTDSFGCGCNGTIYSVTPGGAEKTIHFFGGNSSDGAAPQGALINVNGLYYGVTADWGAGSVDVCGGNGCGTVFSVTPSGVESIVYSFQGTNTYFPNNVEDGAAPLAGLVGVNGTLFGTTSVGGTGASPYGTGGPCGDYGCGTVFSVTPGGIETVLYSFQGGSDGSSPRASLLNVDGTLYGTTAVGGAYAYGTVFSITP
jgi:uncharacterized repeat protein (TIGR03803 family)